MRARGLAIALAALATWGCSSGGGGGGGGGGSQAASAPAPRVQRQQDVITEAEITSRAVDATNALQIVQKLRPQMLRGRGRFSPADSTGAQSAPKVYVDGILYGALETLSNITANQIKEIRYINAADATTSFGTGVVGGVILVTTKK